MELDQPFRYHQVLPQFSISEELLSRNVRRFRGGLVFQAHGLVNHSTLGLESNHEEEESDTTDAPNRLCAPFGWCRRSLDSTATCSTNQRSRQRRLAPTLTAVETGGVAA